MQPQQPDATPPAQPPAYGPPPAGSPSPYGPPPPPPYGQAPAYGSPPAYGQPTPYGAQYPGVPATGYHVPVGRAASLRGPASVAVGALIFAVAINAIDLFATPYFEVAMREVTEPGAPVAMLALIEALLLVLSFLFAGVAFIIWLYQARKNIERWAIGGLGWGPGWAIGGWFIPFANLVIPKLVVDAVKSGSELPPGVPHTERSSSGLINAWWLCFIVAGIAANVYARADLADLDIMQIAAFNGVNCVLYVIAGILGINVVRHITALQKARQAALDGHA